MSHPALKQVLICDTQPIAIEGIRTLLNSSGDLECAGSVGSLEAISDLGVAIDVSAIVLDKALGTPTLLNWLHTLAMMGTHVAPVVWGTAITESEALRFLQAGVRGLLRRTAPADAIVTCLRKVTSGGTWIEEGIFGDPARLTQPRRSALTGREVQIAALVEQGL